MKELRNIIEVVDEMLGDYGDNQALVEDLNCIKCMAEDFDFVLEQKKEALRRLGDQLLTLSGPI